MKTHWIGSCALAALGLTVGVHAETAGTLLFAQPGTQIINENGSSRAASRGDTLQTGERLLTPAGAISQLLLPDGSLIGMRPESEFRLDPPAAGSDSKAPVLALVQGTVRVVASELMDPKKNSSLTLQSGTATLKLKGADLESAVVKGDGKAAAGDAAPGSYQRLTVGSGTVANGGTVAALAPRQISFVPSANAPPTTLNTPAQNVFAGNRPAGPAGGALANLKGGNAATPISVGNLTANTPGLKPMNPVTLPVPAIANPTPKPCTRFIGKTCIQ